MKSPLSRRVIRACAADSACGLLIAAAMALSTASCGSAATPATPSAPAPPLVVANPPATPPPGPPTITVTAAGVNPPLLTIDVGAKVTFVNNDTRPHDFAGGPDPSRPECREIDVAGFLVPGQSRETASFSTARTCEYHDHGQLGVAQFQGRIVIK